MEESVDSGSSTESEYYENVDYEALGLLLPSLGAQSAQDDLALDADANTEHSSLATIVSSDRHSASILQPIDAAVSTEDSNDHVITLEEPAPCARFMPRIQSPERTGSESPSTFLQLGTLSHSKQLRSVENLSCGHCHAFVRKASRSRDTQCVDRLCHCCKIAIGTIERDIVHGFAGFSMVYLRFCPACYACSGSEFMDQVLATWQPQIIKCSGCHRVKQLKEFHKRQQISRPWEEMPGQNNFCLMCLPKGFERDEDAIVPLALKCVTCNDVKDRSQFIRSLKELAMSYDDLEQICHWVNDGLYVCDHCLLVAGHAAMRLPCSKCKQLLKRKQFSQRQQETAAREDAHPSPIELKPVYTCLNCRSDTTHKKAMYTIPTDNETNELLYSRSIEEKNYDQEAFKQQKTKQLDHENLYASRPKARDSATQAICFQCAASVDIAYHPTAF